MVVGVGGSGRWVGMFGVGESLSLGGGRDSEIRGHWSLQAEVRCDVMNWDWALWNKVDGMGWL